MDLIRNLFLSHCLQKCFLVTSLISILTAFLNLIGFDIVFFVPTGYQSVETHFTRDLMEEHQIGEYIYDMQVPDLNSLSLKHTRPTWRDKIFKRGN